MHVKNLKTGKEFHAISFHRLEDEGTPNRFTLLFNLEDRKKVLKDFKPGNFYHLTHEIYDYEIQANIVNSTQLFKITEHYTVEFPTESFGRYEIGNEMFICEDLNNFEQARMVKELTKIDPKRKWNKLLDGKTKEAE